MQSCFAREETPSRLPPWLPQACIRAEQRGSNRRPSDPISFFSACRADRGYVRLALHPPAAVRVSLSRLEALCPGGATWGEVPDR